MATQIGASPRATSDLITKPDPGRISPEEECTLRFAGRSRGSTGASGLGMTLSDSNGSEVWWGYQQYEGATMNEVEYISLITSLRSALSLGVQRIAAEGDNELLYRQMTGVYQVKKLSLKKFYGEATALSKDFASFQMRHVDKTRNERAIQLARNAMEGKSEAAPEFFPEEKDTTTLQEGDGGDWASFDPPAPLVDTPPAVPSTISPDKTYVLRFDGGSRGNPGRAGAGMVLYDGDDGAEVWSGSQYLGEKNTNNEAEYMGLITGLQCARSLGVEHVVVQGDSQLILRQVEGTYQVKSPSLKEYYDEAVAMRKEFASFQTSHIERARNARADALANEAMDTKSSSGFDVS
ncbi:hypothetical protein ACHAXT_007210 [Thalassiosira profunda]